MPFPEILVGDNLISDWELSRIVCDMYNLPFLPVDIHPPSSKAFEGLDREFFRRLRIPTGRAWRHQAPGRGVRYRCSRGDCSVVTTSEPVLAAELALELRAALRALPCSA